MSALPDDAVCVLISNLPDAATAERIAARLLDERLVACVNLQAPCRSWYRWDGRHQADDERPVWFKTSPARAAAAMRRLAELHPYEVPEILRLDTTASAAYAAWVTEETG